MRVVIAGGHGKIALLLERLLAERGNRQADQEPGPRRRCAEGRRRSRHLRPGDGLGR